MKRIKSLYPFRTRFAQDIVAEVLMPKRETGRVAIIATGLPSTPVKKELLQFLADQGYVAIYPRYRGTWESGGVFLNHSPAQDITDVLDELKRMRSFRDAYTGEKVLLKISAVHLFGTSFGGPAVLLNSNHELVKKVIALAPVTNWKVEGETEPFQEHIRFTEEAFGAAFRPKSPLDWQKLITTDFYNPIRHTEKINGRKVFILHAMDDTVVPYQPSVELARVTGSTLYLKPTGGHHLHMAHLFLWKKIDAFLKKR